MDIVSEHYNISVSDIVSKKKNKEINTPRQICMYLVRKYTNSSLQSIGKMLGDRDHTTIMHGAEKITNSIDHDEILRNNIDIIIRKLNPSS